MTDCPSTVTASQVRSVIRTSTWTPRLGVAAATGAIGSDGSGEPLTARGDGLGLATGLPPADDTPGLGGAMRLGRGVGVASTLCRKSLYWFTRYPISSSRKIT